MIKRFFNLLASVIIIVVTYPLSFLPLSSITRLGERLGDIAFHIWKSRRTIAIENITQVINNKGLSTADSPEHIARESFRHLGQSIMELIKIYYNRGDKIIDSVSIHGSEHIIDALKHEKGIILLTGHYGNWELAAIVTSLRITPVSGIARKLNNVYINDIVEKIRSKFGNSVIYKQGALRNILSALKSGKAIGILFDQSVMKNEGIIVDFLCRKAWTIKIPVVISQKTGAPLIPLFIKRIDHGHNITIYPPVLPDKSVSMQENLLKLNRYLEEQIREDPNQWLWIHRRWKRTD